MNASSRSVVAAWVLAFSSALTAQSGTIKLDAALTPEPAPQSNSRYGLRGQLEPSAPTSTLEQSTSALKAVIETKAGPRCYTSGTMFENGFE